MHGKAEAVQFAEQRPQQPGSLTVLQLHNLQLSPGGADSVLEEEAELLTAHGHHVLRYCADNHDIADMSKATAAQSAVWNRRAAKEVDALIRRTRPDLVHVHSTFPLLSPSPLWVAQKHGLAVVQSLHSYRLACLNGLMFRDGAPCSDCISRSLAWPGVVHRCYKDSLAASAVMAVG